MPSKNSLQATVSKQSALLAEKYKGDLLSSTFKVRLMNEMQDAITSAGHSYVVVDVKQVSTGLQFSLQRVLS